MKTFYRGKIGFGAAGDMGDKRCDYVMQLLLAYFYTDIFCRLSAADVGVLFVVADD